MNLLVSRVTSPARIALLFASVLIPCCAPLFSLTPKSEKPTSASYTGLTLEGTIQGSQNQTYVKVPFAVPANTERVTITFEYTGKDEHTVLDLGLLDPAGLRCWRRQQVPANGWPLRCHPFLPARSDPHGDMERLDRRA
jgi:hypothetical protein